MTQELGKKTKEKNQQQNTFYFLMGAADYHDKMNTFGNGKHTVFTKT